MSPRKPNITQDRPKSRVLIYVRYSSYEQNARSITDQHACLVKAIADPGFNKVLITELQDLDHHDRRAVQHLAGRQLPFSGLEHIVPRSSELFTSRRKMKMIVRTLVLKSKLLERSNGSKTTT